MACEEYNTVAKLGAALFFVMSALSAVDLMSGYILQALTNDVSQVSPERSGHTTPT